MAKGHILIVGAGGHARSCADVIEQNGQHCIDGFISNDSINHSIVEWTSKYPVLGTDQDLEILWKPGWSLHIGIGQIRDFQIRKKLFEHGASLNYQFPSIVSPFAYVSPHATVGAGSIIMHGAIINAGAKVGANTIVNSRALIEHDASVGDHCHISTGAIINGGSCVGDCSFVGSSATLQQGLEIPPESFIKMGAVVCR